MVVSVVSRKGGSGKSTTAMHYAALLESRDQPACVVDFDPEGTALSWAKLAGDDLGFPVYSARQLDKALESGRMVVIDTPPNDPKTLGLAARSADRVIVVCGGNDLEADRLGPTLDVLRGSGFDGEWGILLTRVDRGLVGKAVHDSFVEAGLPVLGSIPTRLEYQRAFGSAPRRLVDYEIALEKFL